MQHLVVPATALLLAGAKATLPFDATLVGSGADPCCSWDGCTTCGDTTPYCKANQQQCEGDCNGKWCPSGASPSGSGYDTPNACGSNKPEVAYACMDWNVGSAAMVSAAVSAGMNDTHVFGIGSYGSDASNMGKCYCWIQMRREGCFVCVCARVRRGRRPHGQEGQDGVNEA